MSVFSDLKCPKIVNKNVYTHLTAGRKLFIFTINTHHLVHNYSCLYRMSVKVETESMEKVKEKKVLYHFIIFAIVKGILKSILLYRQT